MRMYICSFIPGQHPSLHDCNSILGPTQSFPPVAGGGLLHLRVRTRVPTPHVTLHFPILQGPQLPSTVSLSTIYIYTLLY